MRKIRIGITAATFTGKAAQMCEEMAPYAPKTIVDILGTLGAVPVILPPFEGADGLLYTEFCDGFILPGGPDTAPYFFHQEPGWAIGPTDEARDRFELALLEGAYAAGKPVLGICRGMQLINIYFGGNVYQDLKSDKPGTYIQHQQKAPADMPTHHVLLSKGTLLGKLFGEKTFVNSRHHQAIHDLGQGLIATAHAPDGVIEGIEHAKGLMVGVQWHPEEILAMAPEQRRLFQWLVDEAGKIRY